MNKKAYLVNVSLQTRVCIPEGMDPESDEGIKTIVDLAIPRFCDKLRTDRGDNFEDIEEDYEMPYDPETDEE